MSEKLEKDLYTCPPGWLQLPIDADNGKCVAPCSSTEGGSNTFYYGPDYGGYPLNRRSGEDRCIDLNNGSDQSGAFDIRSPVWPPREFLAFGVQKDDDFKNKFCTIFCFIIGGIILNYLYFKN
jgi:hypothetical protein